MEWSLREVGLIIRIAGESEHRENRAAPKAAWKAHGMGQFLFSFIYFFLICNSSFDFPVAIIIILTFNFSLFFTVPACASFLSKHNKTKESFSSDPIKFFTEASVLFSLRNKKIYIYNFKDLKLQGHLFHLSLFLSYCKARP